MVDAAQLVPGDIVLLAIGNVVPADVKLLGGAEDEPLQVRCLTEPASAATTACAAVCRQFVSGSSLLSEAADAEHREAMAAGL